MVATALQDEPPPPAIPAPAIDPGLVVKTWMPSWLRWSDLWVDDDGKARNLTHLWSLRGLWRRRPESKDPAWRTRKFGLFVLAYRVEK